MPVLTYLLMILLIVIAWYDFKYLAVPVFLLIPALLISFFRMTGLNNLKNGLSFSGINLTGTFLIIITSFLVLFLLKRKVFNPIDIFMGTGDLLFLPVLCFSFSPLNYFLFLIPSLALLLILKPVIFAKKPGFPLAGGLAVMLSIAILLDLITVINMYNDQMAISLFF
jgi:hypothetical protein